MRSSYVRRQEEVAGHLHAAEPQKIKRDVEQACKFSVEGNRVLCIGTRDGYDMSLFQERGFKPVGVEISMDAVRSLKSKGWEAYQADAHRLSETVMEKFDIVFARHILEHCHSPDVVIKEMVKRLNPNGLLVISCPKGYNENPHHYVCYRDAQELGEHIRDFGLDIIEGMNIQNPPDPIEDEILIIARLETHKLAMINLASACNLDCSYCYSGKGGNGKLLLPTWKQFLKQHSNRWFANFCGTGETFMAPEFGAICREFTNNRSTLVISTNLSVPQVDDILESKLDYVVLLFSLHWEELERKGMLEKTLKRAARLAEYGVAISPTMVLTPEIVPRIPDIAAKVMGECGLRIGGKVLRNAGRHILMEGRNREVCDKHLFMGWYDAELRRDNVKGCHCNAGKAVCWVNYDGTVRACAPTERILGTVNDFKWSEIGTCPAMQCACPLPFMMGSIKNFLPPADEYTVYNNGVSEALKARLSIEVS